MHRLRALGVGLTALALAGYVAGLWFAYPGRAFSIAVLMVGVTLAAIGGGE